MTRRRGDAETRGRKCARAAMLLEVLLSLGLLVFGLSVVAVRINTAMHTAQKGRLWTTGMLLSETIMSKVQGGDIEFNPSDDEIKGHFKIYYPGYSWRIKIRPCEIEDLFLMTLEIGYNDENRELQIQSPEREIDFDDDGTQTIRTVYRLVTKPADINITRDMGIDPEDLQMDEAAAGGQGGEGGEAGGGGGGMDGMGALLALIRDFLAKHPELLNADGGIDVNAIRNLEGEDFDEAMNFIKLFSGDPSGLEGLKDKLGELLGDENASGGGKEESAGGAGQAGGGGGETGGGQQGPQAGEPTDQGGRQPRDGSPNDGGQRNTGGRRPNRQESPAGGRRNIGGVRGGDNSQVNDNLQGDR